MTQTRLLSVAKHESAHVVVGVALGLKMHEAVIGVGPWEGGLIRLGYVWFNQSMRGRREAFALVAAAGIAWDRRAGSMASSDLDEIASVAGYEVEDALSSGGDIEILKNLTSGKHGAESCIKAAGAMLKDLKMAHRKVTRALLKRDLKGADIEAIARGETVEED